MKLPSFESSTKPWFGPLQRARSFLPSPAGEVLEPRRALRAILEALGDAASAVQHVRFIDFVRRDDRRRYTIAIVWTDSDPVARQQVYEAAGVCVDRTGWYPMPQGERVWSKKQARYLEEMMRRRRTPAFDIPGHLKHVESAVAPDGGAAVRVRTSEAGLLLDTGLPGHLARDESDRGVILSHVHSDHAGGLLEAMGGRYPVGMSLESLQTMLGQGVLDRALLPRSLVLRAEESIPLGPHLSARGFRVPHCPGSIGVELTDGRTLLIYTGDISFNSARHSAIDDIAGRLRRSAATRRVVIVDATMAGRREGASTANPANDLLARPCSDLMLLSNDASQLMYAYLDIFHRVARAPDKRHTFAFLMTAKARPLFELAHVAFISRRLDELDPFIGGQYGSSMSAWAETRSLYWLDRLSGRPEGVRRVWFVGPDDAERIALSCEYAVIGRPLTSPVAHGNELSIDTTPWTQHSSQEALLTAVRKLEAEADVILFHNFPRKLQKFAATNGLSAVPLSRSPFSFGSND